MIQGHSLLVIVDCLKFKFIIKLLLQKEKRFITTEQFYIGIDVIFDKFDYVIWFEEFEKRRNRICHFPLYLLQIVSYQF